MKGGTHLQFLLKNNLLTMAPSPLLDEVYAKQEPPLPTSPEPTTGSGTDPVENHREFPNPDGETMLLSQANGKKMTQALDLPQLEVELERAIWQVETAIKKQNAEEAGKEVAKETAKPTTNEDANEATKVSVATPSEKQPNETVDPNKTKSQ